MKRGWDGCIKNPTNKELVERMCQVVKEEVVSRERNGKQEQRLMVTVQYPRQRCLKNDIWKKDSLY